MEAVYRNNFTIRESNNDGGYSPSRSYSYRKRTWFKTRRGYRKSSRMSCKAWMISALFVIGAALFFSLATLIFAPAKKAKAKDNLYETRLVSVRVEKGDSLWSIAEQYYCSEKEDIRDFVAQIKKTNQLESDTIYPDTYLLIQYSVRK